MTRAQMTKYRKKPVVIEAWRAEIDAAFPEGAQIHRLLSPTGSRAPQWQVFDVLHDTWVNFEIGDWIIKGVKGEFYPCKPDVFEVTYEPAALASPVAGLEKENADARPDQSGDSIADPRDHHRAVEELIRLRQRASQLMPGDVQYERTTAAIAFIFAMLRDLEDEIGRREREPGTAPDAASELQSLQWWCDDYRNSAGLNEVASATVSTQEPAVEVGAQRHTDTLASVAGRQQEDVAQAKEDALDAVNRLILRPTDVHLAQLDSTLDALIAAVRADVDVIDPEQPDEPLKLNAYGRACYRAGQESVRADALREKKEP